MCTDNGVLRSLNQGRRDWEGMSSIYKILTGKTETKHLGDLGIDGKISDSVMQ